MTTLQLAHALEAIHGQVEMRQVLAHSRHDQDDVIICEMLDDAIHRVYEHNADGGVVIKDTPAAEYVWEFVSCALDEQEFQYLSDDKAADVRLAHYIMAGDLHAYFHL